MADALAARLEDLATSDSMDPLPIYALANICRAHGRIDLWRQAVDRASKLPHDSPKQIYQRGAMKLLREDWSGWLDLESRIYDPAAGYFDSDFVRHLCYETLPWDGREDLTDRTILLIADGTLGDCVQMLRYVPLVARRAKRVILSVRPEVVRLARENLVSSVTVTLHGARPATSFDRYAWLMSMPALFDELPPPLPVRLPRAEVSNGDRRYGLCVTGVEGVLSDDLDCLVCRDGVRWLNLQMGVDVITLFDAVRLMRTLDGVVTIDTVTAHLAGTLGLRTWLLLESLADARWGLGFRTPWYPSMRILRQPFAGSWAPVIAELRASWECP